MAESPDPRVSYSVKDLLGEINHKLDGALELLHHKADVVRVDKIERDVDFLLQHYEATQERQSLARQWRQWFFPVLVSVVLTLATIVSLFH